MIIDSKKTDILTNISGSSTFKINTTAKSFKILSTNLYSDPIKAIVRELSCNAIDAHKSVKSLDPIDVGLPTEDSAEFFVEDHGVGMTEDEVFSLYTTYFASSKDSSNDQIGALGLGSKSPFSYTDCFSLSTCKNGIRNNFTLYIGDEDVPKVSKLNSIPDNKSGTKVSFLVESKDFDKFHEAATKVLPSLEIPAKIVTGSEKYYEKFSYRHSIKLDDSRIKDISTYLNSSNFMSNVDLTDIRKVINNKKSTDIFTIDELMVKNKFVYYNYGSSFILNMGGVVYPVNIYSFTDKFSKNDERVINKYTSDCIMIIKAGIGDVNISPNRESLHYDDVTVNYIKSKLVEFIKDALISDIKSKDISKLYPILSGGSYKIEESIFKDWFDDTLKVMIEDYKSRFSRVSYNQNFIISRVDNYYGGSEYVDRLLLVKSHYSSSYGTPADIPSDSQLFGNLTKFCVLDDDRYDKLDNRISNNKNKYGVINKLSKEFLDKCESESGSRLNYIVFVKESEKKSVNIFNDFANESNTVSYSDIISKNAKRVTRSDGTKIEGKAHNFLTGVELELSSIIDDESIDKVYYILVSPSGNYFIYNNIDLKQANMIKVDSYHTLKEELKSFNTKELILSISMNIFKENELLDNEKFLNVMDLVYDYKNQNYTNIHNEIDNLNVTSSYFDSDSYSDYYLSDRLKSFGNLCSELKKVGLSNIALYNHLSSYSLINEKVKLVRKEIEKHDTNYRSAVYEILSSSFYNLSKFNDINSNKLKDELAKKLEDKNVTACYPMLKHLNGNYLNDESILEIVEYVSSMEKLKMLSKDK